MKANELTAMSKEQLEEKVYGRPRLVLGSSLTMRVSVTVLSQPYWLGSTIV